LYKRYVIINSSCPRGWTDNQLKDTSFKRVRKCNHSCIRGLTYLDVNELMDYYRLSILNLMVKRLMVCHTCPLWTTRADVVFI